MDDHREAAPLEDLREPTARALALQAEACASIGSPLYAALLREAAVDVAAGGPAWEVLEPVATREDHAVPLRLMAAVHRLVLTRRAPGLALHYPSVGGTAGVDGAWPALRTVLSHHRDELRELVTLPCQTNEVGRCAALAPAFLTVAADTQLPLRLLEVGASGGLNLRWDAFRYRDEGSGRTWGDPGSAVELAGEWDVPAGLLATPVTVVRREGCDPRPLDPGTAEGRLVLTASVWADQTERLERLRGALEIAARVPAELAGAAVADWLPERLSSPTIGVATVVYQSVVWQYLDDDNRTALRETMAAAAQRASADAPLAWLRMEPERRRRMSVRLTLWPGGSERLLARAGAHGFPLRWGEQDADAALW